MFTKQLILENTPKELHACISNVRYRDADETILIFINKRHISNTKKKNYISERQIRRLIVNLKDIFSKEVEVIFQSDIEIEESLKSLLKLKYGDDLLSLFISFKNHNTAHAWIEVTELNEILKEGLEKKLKILLDELSIYLEEIEWIDAFSKMPNTMAILRYIKIHQPVNLSFLMRELSTRYENLNEKWLSKELDKLRKSNLLIWDKKQEKYCITEKSLGLIPSTVSANSSDVERVLALGKKTW
ncbi:hypothetical protein [Kangiella aquimarina]|uniref:Uncharacterized protein n=1 Tax=Kangiella aquimarina TaxID=261965 RepID=A0ABZ0X0R9_9GAMM|nr:hypothetical protein [Kangiella aquimarina]WQG84148.1 hypothetical protein SR900_06630 [Kangiella aquimarina]